MLVFKSLSFALGISRTTLTFRVPLVLFLYNFYMHVYVDVGCKLALILFKIKFLFTFKLFVVPKYMKCFCRDIVFFSPHVVLYFVNFFRSILSFVNVNLIKKTCVIMEVLRYLNFVVLKLNDY